MKTRLVSGQGSPIVDREFIDDSVIKKDRILSRNQTVVKNRFGITAADPDGIRVIIPQSNFVLDSSKLLTIEISHQISIEILLDIIRLIDDEYQMIDLPCRNRRTNREIGISWSGTSLTAPGNLRKIGRHDIEFRLRGISRLGSIQVNRDASCSASFLENDLPVFPPGHRQIARLEPQLVCSIGGPRVAGNDVQGGGIGNKQPL